MMELLKVMGFEYTLWKATDGYRLDSEPLYGAVKFLPGYEDPYYRRPMKKGEVSKVLCNFRITIKFDGIMKILIFASILCTFSYSVC